MCGLPVARPEAGGSNCTGCPAMVTELAWKARGENPGWTSYLDNSDNLALTFVTASHALVLAAGPASHAVPRWRPGTASVGIEERFDAVRMAQRALRLVNDLATYDRDVRTGDLNALMLGVTSADVLGEG